MAFVAALMDGLILVSPFRVTGVVPANLPNAAEMRGSELGLVLAVVHWPETRGRDENGEFLLAGAF